MLHLERRLKTKGEKGSQTERDGKKIPSLGIAHFGKALMQSRLGSAYVLPSAFNNSSSSSPSWSSLCTRLTEADAFRATSRLSSRSARLVSPYLLPRDLKRAGQTDRWPDEREPSRVPRAQHLACAYSNPSRRPFTTQRETSSSLATLIELKITR